MPARRPLGSPKAYQTESRLTALIDAIGPWTDMRPLANSFVGTVSGQYPPQWRLDGFGWVEVAGFIQTPPGATSSYNSLTFYTMPSAARPGSNAGHKWPVTDVTNTSPVGTPAVQVDPTGAMQLHGFPATGMGSHVISIYGRYPLDATGLILV